jgi:hypothetical protein
MRPGLFILLLVAALGARGEIYRWVDEQGNLHFSDKKPEDQAAAKEISGELRPLNSDTSTAETGKLKQVFQGETPEEKAYQQRQQAQQQQQKKARQQACQQARNKLSILRGRVVFLDSNGRDMEVTEDERQQRANKLAEEIRHYCS